MIDSTLALKAQNNPLEVMSRGQVIYIHPSTVPAGEHKVNSFALFLIAFLVGCCPAIGCPPGAVSVVVSWYGSESGNRTASGKAFDGSQLVAAHRSLPFGTMVKFTYRGRSVTVPIEDRGPFVRGRTFDLSRAAAARIGMIDAGVAKVCAERP